MGDNTSEDSEKNDISKDKQKLKGRLILDLTNNSSFEQLESIVNSLESIEYKTSDQSERIPKAILGYITRLHENNNLYTQKTLVTLKMLHKILGNEKLSIKKSKATTDIKKKFEDAVKTLLTEIENKVSQLDNTNKELFTNIELIKTILHLFSKNTDKDVLEIVQKNQKHCEELKTKTHKEIVKKTQDTWYSIPQNLSKDIYIKTAIEAPVSIYNDNQNNIIVLCVAGTDRDEEKSISCEEMLNNLTQYLNSNPEFCASINLKTERIGSNESSKEILKSEQNLENIKLTEYFVVSADKDMVVSTLGLDQVYPYEQA